MVQAQKDSNSCENKFLEQSGSPKLGILDHFRVRCKVVQAQKDSNSCENKFLDQSGSF